MSKKSAKPPLIRSFDSKEEFFTYISESPQFKLKRVIEGDSVEAYRSRLNCASKNTKKILTTFFPYLDFSVKAERFSMGNAVRVSLSGFIPEKSEQLLDFEELKREIKQFNNFLDEFSYQKPSSQPDDSWEHKDNEINFFREQFGECAYFTSQISKSVLTMEAIDEVNEAFLNRKVIKASLNLKSSPSLTPRF